ncbi:ImmA/IrrE family metallo-endopeptidase [Brumimicrobium glaciale]|uniref:ImmA/IrrE family metallo-endopeptidase n=1 Tax=Brumimicrobium glaciale TaxID=200475 RepID=A0A4V1WFL2_9FLAO|nr:ImmA/IrrE family metallo-endopeptidase [Brumimicrobium glaciale]RYM33586.1 ImmA/IrrE family metallo-endopeptidase [Brumimicrobium glaciale]
MAIKKNEYNPESISHPGFTLAEKLEELRMGNKEFSVRVNKPEKTITAVTKGQSSITAEMAVKFEDVLKIPASFWLTRQSRFDEYKARIKRQKDIENAVEWSKGFPYAKMASLGWVKSTRINEEKVMALFNFFGVSDHNAWKSYYYDQELKVSFRISLAHTNESKAVSAWLREGELRAKTLEIPLFDPILLKKSLLKIKSLMAEHPEHFFEDLQRICFAAGVAVLYTPCLPKAPVNGSTRWLGDTPLIQLSARYKTNDKFWFTFFHEVGHILLHGKKYISIENINYGNQDLEKEKEADEFAVEHTFSKEEEAEVINSFPLESDDIINFAKKFNTHPAIIIGRLHKRELIHYSEGREFIESIDLEKKSYITH